MIRFVFVLVFAAVLSFGIHHAYADGQKLVCVYEPMDLFMDKNLPTLISDQVQMHNATVKTVRIIDQILGNNSDCSIVIKIDRAINENYGYTDRTTKYQIDNKTITVFAYKTADVFNPVSGEALKPMTNLSCETTAHAQKYFSNYHITDSGYYSTYTGYCNPYAGHIDPSRVGELPYNIIKNSVDSSLLMFGL
ncbi:MAG TPA: hypothetical protein VFX64_06415 [Candidatus Nitrosotalea sp.]|nr:hypothetical protein [Candidatus Nitrosotalea sp.]